MLFGRPDGEGSGDSGDEDDCTSDDDDDDDVVDDDDDDGGVDDGGNGDEVEVVGADDNDECGADPTSNVDWDGGGWGVEEDREVVVDGDDPIASASEKRPRLIKSDPTGSKAV